MALHLTSESGASDKDTSDQKEPNQLTQRTEEPESGLVAPSEDDDQGQHKLNQLLKRDA